LALLPFRHQFVAEEIQISLERERDHRGAGDAVEGNATSFARFQLGPDYLGEIVRSAVEVIMDKDTAAFLAPYNGSHHHPSS
jgi:hypothetical protein